MESMLAVLATTADLADYDGARQLPKRGCGCGQKLHLIGLMEPIEAFCNRGLRSVSASVYCLFCVRMSRKDIP